MDITVELIVVSWVNVGRAGTVRKLVQTVSIIEVDVIVDVLGSKELEKQIVHGEIHVIGNY